MRGKLLGVPVVPLLRPRPAARFGARRGLEQDLLGRLVESIERRLVHQRDVLRQPGLGVIEIGHGLPCLAVVTGGDRSHEGIDQTGGERPLEVSGLDGDRIGADDLRDALGPRVVNAPGQALHVGDGVDLLLRIDALRRPRHGEQHHQPLRGELALDRGLRRGPKLARLVVARGQKRHDVDAEHRIFVVVHRDQELAHLRLSDPHRALDRGRGEQRGIGIGLDRELAPGALGDLLGEGVEVLAVKIIGRIGGRQAPPHLRAGRRS